MSRLPDALADLDRCLHRIEADYRVTRQEVILATPEAEASRIYGPVLDGTERQLEVSQASVARLMRARSFLVAPELLEGIFRVGNHRAAYDVIAGAPEGARLVAVKFHPPGAWEFIWDRDVDEPVMQPHYPRHRGEVSRQHRPESTYDYAEASKALYQSEYAGYNTITDEAYLAGFKAGEEQGQQIVAAFDEQVARQEALLEAAEEASHWDVMPSPGD